MALIVSYAASPGFDAAIETQDWCERLLRLDKHTFPLVIQREPKPNLFIGFYKKTYPRIMFVKLDFDLVVGADKQAQ